MAGRQLTFSRVSLFFRTVGALLFGSAPVAFMWGMSDERLVRHFALFRLLGAQNSRWLLEAGGLFFVLIGLANLRRLLGSGVAAAIRDDGIQFNSLGSSRFIRWSELHRIRLHQ